MQEVEQQLFTIKEISSRVNIKEKTLYAKVEAGEIPHYRIGRLIRFKIQDIDLWVEQQKIVRTDHTGVVKKTLQSLRKKPAMGIDRIIKKKIDQVKNLEYTVNNGKPDPIKDLGKEVSDGSI